MERIAEPELMDKKEQVVSYDEADFSEGEDNLIKQINYYLTKNNIALDEKNLIVDLGCGPGNISEKLSIRWPKAEVVGIDGSNEMIIKAISNKKSSKNKCKLKNLKYICADIKDFELKEITSKNEITLLVSNSLIHHITHLDDFFKSIIRISNNQTINFHKDLKRPSNEKKAIKLKEKLSKKYNKILINDYYASLRASYTYKELKDFTLVNNLPYLDVFEDGDQYLIIYGKV